MKVLSALAADAQQGLQRLIVSTGLALAAVLAAAVGLGFATSSLFVALRAQYGAVIAALIVSVIYFVIAALLFFLSRRAGRRTPMREAREQLRQAGEKLSAEADTADAPQVAAMAAGLELAKQMTPLQLTLLAALSGFVAGRRL